MAGPPLLGHRGDGGVDHGQLVGSRVGRRVARPQQAGEGLAGLVEEAQHGVEAIAALEVRRCLLLVLGVDLDQRRVDVEDDLGGGAAGGPGPGPALARAPRRATRVSSSIEFSTRQMVGSDATVPNSAGWSRSAAMSDTHTPPPASITATWASSRPRSWVGARSPEAGTACE